MSTSQGFSERLKIPKHILDEWQKLVDMIARFLDVDCVFITEITENKEFIQIKRISKNNPLNYTNEQIFKLNGTFCEKTFKEKSRIMIPNIDNAPEWSEISNKNSLIKAYLGLPLFLSDNSMFGTFCIEHRKERQFTDKEIDLMESFRSMIQAHLELIIKNEELQKLNKRIDGLEKLMKICCSCKKIYGDDEKWHNLEEYILQKTGSQFTHAYCEICGKKFLDELKELEQSNKIKKNST